MLLKTPIETKELILRSLDPSAAHGPYAAWIRNPEVTRYLEVRFAAPDERALEAYVERMNSSEDNLLLGLFPKAEPQQHIGNVKLGPVDRRHGVAAIGIMIGATEFWGRGLAGQAVAATSDYAFGVLGLARVEASFYAANLSSQRAFRRAGFVEEGRRRGARLCDSVRTDEVLMGRLRHAPPAGAKEKE